ncbi:hypothetical protein C2E19_17780 [Pseudomonas sp. DTU12.3]|uniref:hypothetical protein n=1 Tax=Pseudomonas sp. DTU12.3 TaxID=2073078 RepID=UPI00101358CC|nr:hypothetical protein [Pseudomonas sp. DTU12.3]QAX85583.1 hypothetical protein C2E19_17780 [Pseudomonas sp. DTU12.3]
MTTYATLCTAEMSKAESDRNHVGGVCRVNKDDKYLVTFHNNGYSTPASPPMMGETVLQLDPAPRIPPVRASVKKDMEMLHQHSAQREYAYWEQMHKAVSTGQTSYEFEAMQLHRERLQCGLDDYARCVAIVKARQLASVEEKRKAAAKTMSDRFDASAHATMISAKTEEEYVALQKRSLTYPHEYTTPQIANTMGGHAEENFIRAWASLCTHIPEKITFIELFITRMPCPDDSSGFWIGANLYKEGCMGKLAKLISLADEAIHWEITYTQTLNGHDQAFAQSLSRFFPPERVVFAAMGT